MQADNHVHKMTDLLIYMKMNWFPLMTELLFVLSCFLIKRKHMIYANFFFYMILMLYFSVRKRFSFGKWFAGIKAGKKFWKQVVITICFLILAFGVTTILENSFPHWDTGMISLQVNDWLTMMLFIASTMFFPAIVEETFFRQELILFRNTKIPILTTLFGMLLFALEHALRPWGILLCMIWALPLSISYIKTKNIYVPMTAHFLCNVIVNGMTVMAILGKMGSG